MEVYSECCGCSYDIVFTYDYYHSLGVCDNFKEYCSFEEVEDE